MASVNKQSLREEFDTLKARFEHLSDQGKMGSESRALFETMLMLFELLTGQYPWRTGWVNHWDTPRWGVCYFDWEHYTTFATLLKNAGYKTAIAGKWQINDFRVEKNALEKQYR